MAQVLGPDDADLSLLTTRYAGVLGEDDTALAHALCLRDSGVPVQLGAAIGTRAATGAYENGLEVASVEQVCEESDLIVMLESDAVQRATFEEHVAPNLIPGDALVFASGFNVTYGYVDPEDGIDVLLASPMGSAAQLRSAFALGRGVPAFVAATESSSASGLNLAAAYARGLGCTRAGVVVTSFEEFTHATLFGTSVAVRGSVRALIKAAFEQLVSQGTDPLVAYATTVEQLSNLAEELSTQGFKDSLTAGSDVEQFFSLSGGNHVIAPATLRRLRRAHEAVTGDAYARQFTHDQQTGTRELDLLVNSFDTSGIDAAAATFRSELRARPQSHIRWE